VFSTTGKPCGGNPDLGVADAGSSSKSLARPERFERPPPKIHGLADTDGGVDGNARSGPLITIESSHRGQPRRFYAATFLPPLPRRFHERNFRPKSGQQKALENGCVFKGLMSGCGDTQPPIPTLAFSSYLTGSPLRFLLFFDSLSGEGGALGAQSTRRHGLDLIWFFYLTEIRVSQFVSQIVSHTLADFFGQIGGRAKTRYRGPADRGSDPLPDGLRRAHDFCCQDGIESDSF
jgi:hypothetical protein